jgi:sugar phosphate isomerase/epimerase
VFAPAVSEQRPAADQLEEVARALRRHAGGFADHGVTLAIELSEQTLVPSPELLRRVCGETDARAVGVVYDAANMLVEGNLAPWLAVELMGPYLHHVHVKNEAWARERGRWAATIVEPDDGLVDWPVVFRVLEAAGYGGRVVIDHLSGPADEQRFAHEKAKVESLWQARTAAAG